MGAGAGTSVAAGKAPGKASAGSWRFAFDIGGTFTDLVLLGTDGTVHTGKVLSDHDDVVAPIRTGLLRMLEQQGIAVSEVNEVVAGATTAVTNLVIERKGARTGLVVALTIPLVLAATFVVMAYFGIDLHKISLGSLVLALG